MRLTTVVTTLSLVALFVSAPGALAEKADKKAKRLQIGDKAVRTDVKMKGVDDKEYSIKDVAGEKGTLVIFTCNHCPWVIAWQERIAQIGNEYRRKGFGVIAINSNDSAVKKGDDLEGMKQRSKKVGMEYPYVIDATSDVARDFGATKTPEIFLFDAKMKLVYHGAVDDNGRKPKEVEEPFLKNALEAMLAGKKIAKPETKSLGCGIKMRAKKEAARQS